LFNPIARKVVRSRDVVFVEDQTIEDTVKTKEKVPESIPVGVPPQRQQQDRVDSDLEPADSAQQEADDDAEYVQYDAHSESMMMLKKMIMINKKHQYQIVHQQLYSDGPAETVFLTLGMHQINM
jgi:hypothetical protein